MNAFHLAKLAALNGYAIAVKAGMCQVQSVSYQENGTSIITAHTVFLPIADAARWISEHSK